MDAPVTVTSPRAGRGPCPAPARGHLRFSGVRFRFADTAGRTAPDLLRGVDLDIAPGETMALVGATGSGKTTLTALVNRLYDVTGGAITLDGVDIRELDLADLRRPVVDGVRGADAVLRVRPGERPARARPDGTDERRAARAGASRRPTSSTTCRGAWTPGSASRACPCPAVSGSGWRWPAPWSAGRAVLVLDDPLSALDIHTEAAGRAGTAVGAARHDGADRRAPRVDRAARRPGGAARATAGSPRSARTPS